MSSLRAVKWLVQNQTHRTTQKHVEHQDATDIHKNTHYVLCFSEIFAFTIS